MHRSGNGVKIVIVKNENSFLSDIKSVLQKFPYYNIFYYSELVLYQYGSIDGYCFYSNEKIISSDHDTISIYGTMYNDFSIYNKSIADYITNCNIEWNGNCHTNRNSYILKFYKNKTDHSKDILKYG